MTQQADKLMMAGCDGKQDYLVVVKFGSAAIGVKPVIDAKVCQEKGPQIIIGTRIRLAAAPGNLLLNAEHMANTLCTTIPWQKKAIDHCSVFLGSMVPPFPTDMNTEMLVQILEETAFFEKITSCLGPVYELDGTILSTMAELKEFLQSQYAVIAEGFLKKAAPSGNGGTVVPFRPSLHKVETS